MWAPLFGVEPPDFPLRFNVAPTQEVPIVRKNAEGHREVALARWGLIPSWADDPKIGSRMINARSETAATKPSFRAALKKRRCLVVSDGFYEWHVESDRKQPYYVCRSDRAPWGLAGLWECWQRGELRIESCTILTTESSQFLRPLHERMPVILQPADYARWLDPAVDKAEQVADLLRPFPGDELAVYPVSTRVNNPRNESTECLEPLAAEAAELSF